MEPANTSLAAPGFIPRGFSQLHQDAWDIARRYPFYFFVLPAVLFFPFDFLSEWIVSVVSKDGWAAFKLEYRMAELIDLLVGVFVSAVQLNVLKCIAKGDTMDVRTALRAGFSTYFRLVQAGFLLGVRVGLRFLLLIVPGIQKGCALAMTFPVVVFEGREGDPALLRSEILMRGQKARLFRYGLGAVLIYSAGYFGLLFFSPDSVSPLWGAFESVPWNVMGSLWTIGICLFYADLTGDVSLSRPVGIPGCQRPEYDEISDRPRKTSVVLAIMIALALLIAGFMYSFQQPYFEGARQFFGEAQHEIYFPGSMSTRDVQQIMKICSENELFKQDDSRILLLEEEEDQYVLNIISAQEDWEDENLLKGLDDLYNKLAVLFLKKPVRLMLYDDWAERKTPVPAPAGVITDLQKESGR